ncbi:hypothetical protein C1645_545383 [Glomus cerebriforme]|uniref:GYF domain-containing protein n=1 Tax=Glomus cerebriforme TaxID=658196 RepID=A0A397SBL1_9GLOM|nr:hypothetical protein C1645_545383 [Glomus cerebriforme]
MNEWYKGGFFVHSLLVKRVEDTTFEPLGVLIRKTGDDERPFSAQMPGSRPSLTISMPNNSSRLVNDPFQRSWVGPNSPSTAQLFLDHQQRFNPFGGTASVPNTPFDRYQFGSVFGRNDVSSGGWGDLNSTNNTWGQTESFTSNNENLSPRVQAPNSPPLFNNNSATFNVSPPQNYLDHQRVFSSQIERQQFMMLQQRQLQQNQHSYPDTTFIRQQHQSYVGISGPVSAPISNAPTSPFTRSTGWTATTSTEQQTPSSPWGPGIGVTSSRAPHSDEIGYFGSKKDNNIGLLQQSHIDKIPSRRNERQFEVISGNIQDSSFDSNVNEKVKSMTIVDDEIHSKKVDEKVMSEGKAESSSSKNIAVDASPNFTQKEELYRTKPSLREIQAEEELRKKQQQEKEKLSSAAQQTSNPTTKATQPQKTNSAAWGNNNSVTPSSPAPWAKDEDHTTHKTPSLREIQEMEARKAAERKAASTTTTQSTVIITKEESTPPNSWGIIGQNSSSTSNSSSLSTSPVVTTPAWQSNNSAPKKTLREIQKEEEEAMKKRNKIREMQQQVLLGANSGIGAPVTNNMGKRYADTVATGNGGLGTKVREN